MSSTKRLLIVVYWSNCRLKSMTVCRQLSMVSVRCYYKAITVTRLTLHACSVFVHFMLLQATISCSSKPARLCSTRRLVRVYVCVLHSPRLWVTVGIPYGHVHTARSRRRRRRSVGIKGKECKRLMGKMKW